MTDLEPVRACIDRVLPAELARRRQRIQNPLEGAEPDAMRMAVPLDKPWDPGRTLTVSFLDGLPVVQATVEEFAHKWSEIANIHFDFGDHAEADIRISFELPGSWSYLGKDAIRRPYEEATMNYGWLTSYSSDDEYRRVVTHEFGHALGAIHEHQHPEVAIPWDKPKVYAYYALPPNLWDEQTVEVNIFEAYDLTSSNFSDYDPESIMHYPIPQGLTLGDFSVDWNNSLSPQDIAFIGTQYPFDVKDPNELVVGAEPVQNEIGEHGEEDTFTFRITEPGAYIVETHGEADLVMALFGPDDRDARIGGDDDSGRDYNARIGTVLGEGSYWLRVWHFWPRASSPYGVTLQRGPD